MSTRENASVVRRTRLIVWNLSSNEGPRLTNDNRIRTGFAASRSVKRVTFGPRCQRRDGWKRHGNSWKRKTASAVRIANQTNGALKLLLTIVVLNYFPLGANDVRGAGVCVVGGRWVWRPGWALASSRVGLTTSRLTMRVPRRIRSDNVIKKKWNGKKAT